MDTLDLTNDWWLQDDGQDVVLMGPGHLRISLPAFDAHRLVHMEGLPPEVAGSLRQIGWRYPLDQLSETSFEEVWLWLIATWGSAAPAADGQYHLHVGTQIIWTLPADVGQRLEGWFARQEEHDRQA